MYRVITSDQALVLERLPESVVVIGAGAIGLEFATVFNAFGTKVTVLEALPRVAPLEDEDISKEAARAFKKRGIDAFPGVKVQDVKDAGHSTKEATKKTGGKVKKTTTKGTHKAAHKTKSGAQKVEDKTTPPPPQP